MSYSEIPGVHPTSPIVDNTTLPPVYRQTNELIKAVKYLERVEYQVVEPGSQLRVTIDAASDRPVVEVVDERTKQVLYQIPPKDIIRMAVDARRRNAASESLEDSVQTSPDE